MLITGEANPTRTHGPGRGGEAARLANLDPGLGWPSEPAPPPGSRGSCGEVGVPV